MHQKEPRGLRSAEARAERLAAVDASPVTDLNDWVRSENVKRGFEMPWFDPGDAGGDARVLFLLESPGPMADHVRGSGLISVDNDDPTAQNLWTFRRDAGLLDDAVHWNAVPWYLGTTSDRVVAPSTGDRRRAVALTRSLLSRLPALEVVVPMGNHAKRVWGLVCDERPNNYATLPTWHPSALGLAGAGKRDQVQVTLERVRALLDASVETPPEALAPRLADGDHHDPKRTEKLLSDLRKRGQRWRKTVRSGSGS